MPNLRPYRPEDWDDFLALDLETGRASLRSAPTEERDAFAARWALHLKSSFAWTAAGPTTDASQLLVVTDDDGTFAGHLWLCERADPLSGVRRLCVATVAIAPPFRSRGWGRLLMTRAIEEARARGLASVGLGVAADNVVARKLYEEMGFVATEIAMVVQVAQAHLSVGSIKSRPPIA